MSHVGEHFAKMLLRKQRAIEAESNKAHALFARAAAELHSCLEENVESLNSFPGIGRKIILMEAVSDGFSLYGVETGFGAYVTIKRGRLRLGQCEEEPEGTDKLSDEEDVSITEWYDVRWSDDGVQFVSFDENDNYFVRFSVDVIVGRAFGLTINGTVSPIFSANE